MQIWQLRDYLFLKPSAESAFDRCGEAIPDTATRPLAGRTGDGYPHA
jgi:hypothetical protein